MTTMLTVKPSKGVRVRRPDGVVLDAAGETLPDCTYWQRRIADGDVVVAPADSNPKTKA